MRSQCANAVSQSEGAVSLTGSNSEMEFAKYRTSPGTGPLATTFYAVGISYDTCHISKRIIPIILIPEFGWEQFLNDASLQIAQDHLAEARTMECLVPLTEKLLFVAFSLIDLC